MDEICGVKNRCIQDFCGASWRKETAWNAWG